MRRFILSGLVVCASFAACGDGARTPADTTTGFVPPPTQMPSPLPGQAHTTLLTAYVGRYPDQPVGGVAFFDRTEIATALNDAVGDAALRRTIVQGDGPQTPIFRIGGRIASWGCEAHDCGAHNWTLVVDPASGKGEVCVHEGGRSRWYAGGSPTPRPGGCPSERRAG